MAKYLLILLLFSYHVTACEKGLGDSIKINGTFSFEILPGKPGFNSFEAGDMRETVWFANPAEPLCFKNIGKLTKIQLDISERVNSNQLMEPGGSYEFIGQTIPAKGKSHRTKLILKVQEINRL